MWSLVYPSPYYSLMPYTVPFYRRVLTLHECTHFTETSFTLQKGPHSMKDFLHFTEESSVWQRVLHLQTGHPFYKKVFIELSSLYRMSLHFEEVFSAL